MRVSSAPLALFTRTGRYMYIDETCTVPTHSNSLRIEILSEKESRDVILCGQFEVGLSDAIELEKWFPKKTPT